jgi:REP element-mobilizing transposase RayT
MGRTRYKIYESTHPHFVICTILHWLPIFTRQESVQIIIDSIKFLQEKDNLIVYAYVILENHLHMIVSSDDLHKTMQSFKQFTAKQILDMLKKANVKTILDQLMFYKKANHKEKTYQVWEEGYQPKLIQSDEIMIQKINYIHHNPVKRGYVDEAIHWRYSSARDYEGIEGLVEVERFW